MDRFQDVQNFALEAHAVEDVDELHTLMDATTRSLCAERHGRLGLRASLRRIQDAAAHRCRSSVSWNSTSADEI